METNKAVQLAQDGDLNAQRHLYEQYKVALFSVCLRYGRDHSEAEDILQEGFIHIFKDLHQYQGKGSLLGWMRKVLVNNALQYLRKWKRDWNHIDISDYQDTFSTSGDIFQKLGLEELTHLIQKLPVGYRLVFNLYVIEGYAHKEIAEMLNISVNTSKTQLFKAKALLRKQLETQLLTRIEVYG